LAVGFASLFNDRNMVVGDTPLEDPQPEMPRRYDVFYALIRLIVEGKPIAPPADVNLPMEQLEPRE
jgi:hypothetical protein